MEALPEVILLDLSMPIMDGWQFLDWKNKQHDDLVKVPVVIVSAIADFSTPPVGAVGVLRKPVSVTRMIDYIQSFC